MRDTGYIYAMAICALFLIGACKSMDANQVPVSETVKNGSEPAPHDRISPDEEEFEKAAAFKKIQEALEEAKRTGKTTVDVFLDEIPDKVQTMDLVRVAYRAATRDGQDLPAPAEALTDDKGRVVETLIAGKPTTLPGLGNAVLDKGLEAQVLEIPAEEAFGIYKEAEKAAFHSVRSFPLVMTLDADTYQKRFNRLPSTGDRLRVNPYFESEVIEVQNGLIRIKNLAQDGYRENSAIGMTRVSVDKERITLKLDPIVGAPFIAGQKKGKIVSKEADNFTVDFNHPLAGKPVRVELEVMDIIKPSAYKDCRITWIDDHDQGVDTALADKKDKVLVLYADWCQWCERLFSQTFTDPRIAFLKDRFVFVKANSDQDKSLKELYGQEGYPMVILTDYKGKIYDKFEGFKTAQSMLNILERIINHERIEADT